MRSPELFARVAWRSGGDASRSGGDASRSGGDGRRSAAALGGEAPAALGVERVSRTILELLKKKKLRAG